MKKLYFFLGILLYTCHVHAIDFHLKTLNKPSYFTDFNNDNTVIGFLIDRNSTNYFKWKLDESLSIIPYPFEGKILVNNYNQIAGVCQEVDSWSSSVKKIYITHPTKPFIEKKIPLPQDYALVDFNDQLEVLLEKADFSVSEYQIWSKDRFYKLPQNLKVHGFNNHGILLVERCSQNYSAFTDLSLYDFKNHIFQEVFQEEGYLVRATLNDLGEVCIVQSKMPGREKTYKGFLWTLEVGVMDLGGFLPLARNNNNQMIGVRPNNKQDIDTFLFWNKGEIINLEQNLKKNHPELSIKDIYNTLKGYSKLNDKGYIIGNKYKDTPFIIISK